MNYAYISIYTKLHLIFENKMSAFSSFFCQKVSLFTVSLFVHKCINVVNVILGCNIYCYYFKVSNKSCTLAP